MNHIRKLHEEAMDLAEMAFIAKRKGDLEQANQLFRQAYENEAQVVRLMLDENSPEPTRSVLYRSAASLALYCNEFREAERLIKAGLAGEPPEEIAEELRDLYEEVKSRSALVEQHIERLVRSLEMGEDDWLQELAKLHELSPSHYEKVIEVRREVVEEVSIITSDSVVSDQSRSLASDIFVVPGRDEEAKESLSRFIERLGLHVIILEELPSAGRTIIDKFEDCSDIGFAIVLLTSDDVGVPPDSSEEEKLRARQNVILELGYLVGRLGRTRVCVLYKEGIETPSGLQGVSCVRMDSAGRWQLSLAKEIGQAGMKVDLDKVSYHISATRLIQSFESLHSPREYAA